jgi:threonine synthase
MRFLSTRALQAADSPGIEPRGGRNAPVPPGATFRQAIIEGLAPDGGLYVPERIDPWSAGEIARLANRTLTEIAYRALRPYTRGELDATVFEAVVVEALNFPIPLVEVEPGIYALELFHGPTLAFKDVGARTMARIMASIDSGDQPLTVLAATSGDTGSAVAHAFHGVPHTRVVVLYPDGRVSPTQEAQLTMFNAEQGGNVRAYAVAGSFDECHSLTKAAFGNLALRERVRLTSANSVNIGRLLPQMVYYFHAIAQLHRVRNASASERLAIASRAPASSRREPSEPEVVVSTPSGNFGNLTAGLFARRAGLPIARFVASTNINDVVPRYLTSGRFDPRPSVQTLANAMDVGNPSNFERMLWLYGGDVDAMRREICGVRYTDDEVRDTIRRVYEDHGYLLDPHSAIAYRGLTHVLEAAPGARVGIFLATAHPAKFAEIVEPVIGRMIELPPALAHAVARTRTILTLPATLEAVAAALMD